MKLLMDVGWWSLCMGRERVVEQWLKNGRTTGSQNAQAKEELF